MPKLEPTGDYRVRTYRTVKTFGDQVKEFAQGVAGIAVIVVIAIAIFT